MNVLGIYGSPRKRGNSDVILDKTLASAEAHGARVRRVYCRKLDVKGCLECGGCDETGQCVVEDDMARVYPDLEWADAIILAAPVFFYNVPAQAKAVIDRSQACWAKRLLNKGQGNAADHESGKGYLIGVGATKGKNLFTGMELTAKYFYDAMDMSYHGGLLLRGLEGKGEAAGNREYMDQAGELGRKIVKGE